MSSLSDARKRDAKLAKKQERQRKRYRRNKKGSPQRHRAKKALARLGKLRAGVAAQIAEIKQSLRVDWGGHQSVPRLRRVTRFAERRGLVVTSTTGGAHATGSYHYQRRAVDLAGGSAEHMAKVQRSLYATFGAAYFLELFGPAGFYVKNGVRIEGHFPDHGDHIHAAR